MRWHAEACRECSDEHEQVALNICSWCDEHLCGLDETEHCCECRYCGAPADGEKTAATKIPVCLACFEES